MDEIRGNSEESFIREIIYTDEFKDFYDSLDEKVQKKIRYAISIVETIYVVSTDFVKKLEETDLPLYEMRVSIGSNEYRTIIFSIDNDNFMQATRVILLNSFLKKSSKDYKKQIKTAEKMLNGFK
jgi:mRNA-degrading endonuclease RelE of RelBE toxin-antitoxin system